MTWLACDSLPDKWSTGSMYSTLAIAWCLVVQLSVLLSVYVSPEGAVLALRLESGFSRCALRRVGEDRLGGRCCLTELGLAVYLRFGEGFGTRVADLRRELGSVHLLVDDLRVLADFALERCERGFEFNFRHCGSALFRLVPCEGLRLVVWQGTFFIAEYPFCGCTFERRCKGTAFLRQLLAGMPPNRTVRRIFLQNVMLNAA